MTGLSASRRGLRILTAAIILGLLGFLAGSRDIGRPAPFPFCAFKATTGLPCALCGGTRATRALLHGDVSRAWQLNAIAFPAVLFLLVCAGILLWEATRGRALADWPGLVQRYGKFAPVLIVILIAWWVPQIMGALNGTKGELIDLGNPIARNLREKFR